MNTTVLGIDPSSQVTGCAVMVPEGSNLPRLTWACRVTADKKTAPAMERIDDMVSSVREILQAHKPRLIVIEITSGRTAGRYGEKKISGLPVYGMAVGAVQQACMDWAALHVGVEVIRVQENVWTRRKRKETRAMAVHAMYPNLDWSSDTGHDIADAVGLALWGIGEKDL